MKKVLLTICLIVLMLPPHARAGEPDSDDSGFSSYGIISGLIGGDSPADFFKEAFNSEKNAGQNLYKAILARTVIEPNQEALKAVAQSYGFTLTEAKQTLNYSLEPMLQKHTNLTQNQALNYVTKFRESFEEAYENIADMKEIETEIETLEIFANGDLSDSGFDLIYDLDLIEKILFLNNTESDTYTGGQVTDKDAGPAKEAAMKSQFTPYPYLDETGVVSYEGADNAESDATETPTTETPESIGESIGEKSKIPKSEDASAPKSAAESAKVEDKIYASEFTGSEFIGLEKLLTADDSVERDACESPSNLITALTDFEEEYGYTEDSPAIEDKPVNGDLVSNPMNAASGSIPKGQKKKSFDSSLPSKSAPADSSTDSPDDSDSKFQSGFQESQKSEDFEKAKKDSDVKGKEGSDWLKEDECPLGEFLCVKLDFIYKQASSFNNSANCIACHVEKINDAWAETMRKSLTPSKVTGQLFESGKCKSGYSLPSFVNLNLILVPIPPLMPMNDDLIFMHSIEGEWKKFVNRYTPFGYDTENEMETALTLSEFDYSSGSGDTATQLFDSVQRIKEEAAAQITENLEKYEKSKLVDSKSEFFRVLGKEMDQMNMYFGSFKYIFEQMSDAACKTAGYKDVE